MRLLHGIRPVIPDVQHPTVRDIPRELRQFGIVMDPRVYRKNGIHAKRRPAYDIPANDTGEHPRIGYIPSFRGFLGTV